MKKFNNSVNTRVVLGVGLVAVIFYTYGGEYFDKLLAPNVTQLPKVIEHAAPVQAATPVLVRESVQEAKLIDDSKSRLQNMRWEVQTKAEIMDMASQSDIQVQFADPVIYESGKPTNKHPSSVAERSMADAQMKSALTEEVANSLISRFGLDNTSVNNALMEPQIDVSYGVTESVQDSIGSHGLLDTVKVSVTVHLNGKPQVVMSVDGNQWDTSKSFTYGSLVLKSLTSERICISEGARDECYAI